MENKFLLEAQKKDMLFISADIQMLPSNGSYYQFYHFLLHQDAL